MEKICGVYMLRSKIKPRRCYVGSSTNITYRFYIHRHAIKHLKHHSIKLTRHVAKYGKDDIEYVILERFDFISKKHLLGREQYYLDLLKPYFNCAKYAGSPTLGTKQSKELRKQKSRLTRGIKRGKMSPEHKRNWYQARHGDGKGNCLTGVPKSQATKDKIRNTLRGRKPPPLTEAGRQRLIEINTGKHHSEETKAYLSVVFKGRIPWNKGLRYNRDENGNICNIRRIE